LNYEQIFHDNLPVMINFSSRDRLIILSAVWEKITIRLFIYVYCKGEIWAVSWQNQHNGFATSMDPDQDPCCSLTNSITTREPDSEQHGSWSDCACSRMKYISILYVNK
jgi:hypothetical protein